MADATMLSGLRVFTSGGAEQLPTEYIRKVYDVAKRVLEERGEDLSERLMHFDCGDHWVSCGAGAARGKRKGEPKHVAGSSKNVKEVNCKSCKKTKLFKLANGDALKDDRPVHLRVKETYTVQNYSGGGYYRNEKRTVYRPACYTRFRDVVLPSQKDKWPSSNLWSSRKKDVTCKNCLRSKKFKKKATSKSRQE